MVLAPTSPTNFWKTSSSMVQYECLYLCVRPGSPAIKPQSIVLERLGVVGGFGFGLMTWRARK